MKIEKVLFFSILAVLVFIIIINFTILNIQNPLKNNLIMPKLSKMSLTDFDKQKARELMDKNNDGKCDYCGMPVEVCIDGGELECTMNPNAKIGKLGSQHIHADWKIFINGKEFDFSKIADRHEKQMHGDQTIKDTSAFIHIHPIQLPEKSGNVLHMHATGISLGLFFESLGMKLTKDCITVLNDEKYCTDDENTLKFYVNGKLNNQYSDYVFSDSDKILISYGLKDSNMSEQLALITNFAETH